MKKIVLLFTVLFLSCNTFLYSQSGWYQQYSGVNVSLYSSYFVNSNTGWISGDSGKILKTSNGGSNWIIQNSTTQYPLLSIFFLNENTGWCSGGVADFNVFPNRMIVLKTTNGGNSWVTSYFSNSAYSCFASIYFTDAMHGSVVERGGTGSGTVGGLWTTSDGGYNWTPAHAYATSDLEFTDASTGWTIGSYGDDTGHDTCYISKSIDGGNTWNKIYQRSKMSLFSSHFMNNNTGWIAGHDHENFLNDNIILKTTTGGANWEKYILGQNIYVEQIFFSDLNIGWGCSSRIYRTSDSGLNWELQLDYIGCHYFSIIFTDSLKGWVTGTNGVILKTITGGLNSIANSNKNLPDNFSLSQNYPNPFNPTTTIKYNIPLNVRRQTSDVRIIVYDALGKEIALIVNEKQNAGSYSVEWDASNFPSGIYFYKLVAGDVSEVRKMTLLK